MRRIPLGSLALATLSVALSIGFSGRGLAQPRGPATSSFVVLLSGCGLGDVPCRGDVAPGELFDFQVVAYGSGSIQQNFDGLVRFAGSDPRATLPADYRFTASDGGVHTFRAIFQTAGPQVINAVSAEIGWGSGSAQLDVRSWPPIRKLDWTRLSVRPPDFEITSLVEGFDDNLWFVWSHENATGIGRVDVLGTDLPVPIQCVSPRSLIRSLDGSIFYACGGDATSPAGIGRIDSTHSSFFPLPAGASPQDLAIGVGGIWFTDDADRIGKLTLPFGFATFFALPPSTVRRRPFRIVEVTGSVWFTERNGGIGRVDPTGAVREWVIPSGAVAQDLAIDPRNPEGVVFTEAGVPRIGTANEWAGVVESPVRGGGAALAVATDLTYAWLTTDRGVLYNRDSPESYTIPDLALGKRLVLASDGGFLLAGAGSIARVATAPCGESTNLCLDGRFTAQVEWKAPADSGAGRGIGVPLTQNAGYFWFFSPNNVELVVKLVDGRVENGHYWFFAASLTDLEFTVTVTDTWNGSTVRYSNPPGRLASIADVSAF